MEPVPIDLEASGDPRDRGIVVLGMPRSGTTLLRRILDAHPRIVCGGETFLLRAAARFLQGDTVADGIDYGVLGGLVSAGFTREEVTARLRGLTFELFADIAGRAGKPRWASKTAVDSFYVEEIERIFGGHVRFVCIVRHGLDVACSLQELCEVNETYIRELHPYVVRHPSPKVAFTHAWADVTKSLLELAERRPTDTVLLRYEELVESPSSALLELFRFLEEDVDDALLTRAFSGDRAEGLGDWKTYATAGIEKDSLHRYRELPETMVSQLGAIANPVLELAGYESVPVSAPPDADEAMRRYEMRMTLSLARARATRKRD